MTVATSFAETPWSTDQLAAIHGVSGPWAKRKQDDIDRLIHDVLAPHYVARGVRADQAANSIRHLAARLHRLFEHGGDAALKHTTHLIKLANDKAVVGKMDGVAKRLPSATRTGRQRPANRRERQTA